MKSKKSIFRILSMAAAAMVPVFLATSAYAVPLAYVANQSGATVTVINTTDDSILDTIQITGDPRTIVSSPDGSRVYVSTGNAKSIVVIDTASNTQIDEIDLGDFATGLDIAPDGSKLYAVSNNDLVAVDLSNNALNNIGNAGTFVIDVAFSPNGEKAYLTDFFGGVVKVANATNDTLENQSISPGMNLFPASVDFSPDGSKAYVTTLDFDANNNDLLKIINVSDGTVSGEVVVGNTPVRLDVSSDGSKVYVANSLSDNLSVVVNDAFLKNIVTGDGTNAVKFIPGTSKAYATNGAAGTISVINTDDDTLASTIEAVGDFPLDLTIVNVVTCGDGVKEGSEQCDDGNTNSGDGCSSICKNESEPVVCGDGKVEGTEECDDGNGFNDDECSNACTIVEPKDQAGDGCSLSPLSSASALSFLPLAMAPLAVALRRFKKKA